MRLRLVFAAALLVAPGGCSGDPVKNEAEVTMAVVTIKTAQGPRTLNLEVADTQAKQERGLMYRSNIPSDGGMLIAPYPPNGGDPKEVDFWTRNVPVPIDFIFIRADGTIARIAENAVPFSETRISSGEPIVAAIEINGGRAAELGIAPGDSVSWPGQRK